MCFLDWQISRYGPPALDLLYHIFSATDGPFRKLNYNKLLKTYYDSLSSTIRKLGSDPDKLYTFESLQSQLRKCGSFALLYGPMILQVRVAKACHFSDLDEFAERIDRGEDADIMKEFDDVTMAEYGTLINDVVSDLVSYGYIQQ